MKEPLKQYLPAEKLELPKIKKEFPKVIKRISCPTCGEDADQINLNNNVASCKNCSVVFSIQKEIEGLKTEEEAQVMKQEFFRPEGIDLFYYKDDLEISVEGIVHESDIVGIVSSLLFLEFGGLYYLTQDLSVPYLILAITVLPMLFFIYRAITHKKNRMYIDINQQNLSVKNGNTIFKKDQTFLAEDIDQIYLKKVGGLGSKFDLYLIYNGRKGQQHHKLFSTKTLSKAKYLEQEIEKYLGIEDRKVPEATA